MAWAVIWVEGGIISNVKIALEGLLYPLFLVAVLFTATLGIVCMGLWFGLIPFCVAFAVAATPLCIIHVKRENAEQQRHEKPTPFLTDEERSEAIEYLIKAKKRNVELP